MRIGFLSYEFPTETGGGGIATYLAQATDFLSKMGHEIVVFCGTSGNCVSEFPSPSLEIRRVPSSSSLSFRKDVVAEFSRYHRDLPFDVIEGCDFDASALEVKRVFPQLPYVVKLHTPRFVIDHLQNKKLSPLQKLRMQFGALRRGSILRKASIGENGQAEEESVRCADEIAAPSRAIADLCCNWNGVDSSRISIFPYVFQAPEILLSLPIKERPLRVTFLGRLEYRKGVEDFVDAIPSVVDVFPEVTFLMVGRPMDEGRTGKRYDKFLQERLGTLSEKVEFTGQVAPAELGSILGETAVLVAPSHWESFGLICCEGMAAGCAVIGSSSGGMAEILDEGRYGELVDPHSPQQISRKIVEVLSKKSASKQLSARRHIENVYKPEKVLPLQIESYSRAIRKTNLRRPKH